MMSNWTAYYPVFLSAFLSLGIPIGLAGISFLFFQEKKTRKRQPILPLETYSALKTGQFNQTILGQRINIRFFLAVNASLMLMTLALELIPCTAVLHSEKDADLWQCLLAIVTLAGFAVLGLLYAVRKGDMSWLTSFRNPSKE